MEKQFTVHTREEIPPVADQVLQVSEWYFAKVLTLGNEIKNCLAAYDFKRGKWIFTRSGYIKLVKYYKE